MDECVYTDKLSPDQLARKALESWQRDIARNIYTSDEDYIHLIRFHFQNSFNQLHEELSHFGKEVIEKLEPLVIENNGVNNLPRLEMYNAFGETINRIHHHPTYIEAGNIIYKSGLLKKMAVSGGMSECLAFLFLSSQTGEAGHNCPVACSAGIIRVLQRTGDFSQKQNYIAKLISPSFETNFTGAQFLTEIQGGSDVGKNVVYAKQEKNAWRVYGEKWFCSNAGADLIFATARYDLTIAGTKGLGLFLIPAQWEGVSNGYTIRRLKDKLGTRSMATGEIYFHGAHAFPIGPLDQGFHLAMDYVLHTSRLFNSVCVLGMARRALSIAYHYAKNRVAFSHPIIHYPSVKETLAIIKAENSAMLAAIFATARLQDQYDTGEKGDEDTRLLLRLLVNMQKYYSAKYSAEHIHHALDVLAGNGTIETFSSLPRLLRDCIICENWEGTHNVLHAQILKDMDKYAIDKIFLRFMHAECAKLKSDSHYTQMITQLSQVEEALSEFRQLESEIQLLLAQTIVDKMAVAYCALMLLIEARDQEKNHGSLAKLNCFHYFLMLKSAKPEKANPGYLSLINKIIQ